MPVNENDKYYTPPSIVERTIQKAYEFVGIDNIHSFIEPGAGDGAFIKPLKETGKPCRFLDLYPEHPEIEQCDFLKVKGERIKGRVIIGNPPYGIASTLWKSFCKKGAELGDWIIYVSPASQYNSNYYLPDLELVDSEHIGEVEYYGSEAEGGSAVKVHTCINTYRVKGKEKPDHYKSTEHDRRKRIIKRDFCYNTKSMKGEDTTEYDFYLAGFTSGKIGRFIEPEEFKVRVGITVKNLDLYDKAEAFFKNFGQYEKELKEVSVNGPRVSDRFLLNKIWDHFYADDDVNYDGLFTYENFLLEGRNEYNETLFKDFKINGIKRKDDVYHPNPNDFDYHIVGWGGSAGRLDKELTNIMYIGIKLYNEELREKANIFFKTFLDKYKEELRKASTSSITLQLSFLYEKMYSYFYQNKEEIINKNFDITSRKKPFDVEYDFYMEQVMSKYPNLPRTNDSGYLMNYGGYTFKCIGDIHPTEKQWNDLHNDIYGVLSAKDGPRNGNQRIINVPLLMEKMYEHFFEKKSKEEMVRSIFQIEPRHRGKGVNQHAYEYILCSWGIAGKLITIENDLSVSFGINLLDESLRNRADYFFSTFRDRYLKDIKASSSASPGFHTPYLLEKIYNYFFEEIQMEDRIAEDFNIQNIQRVNKGERYVPIKKKPIYKEEDLQHDYYLLKWGPSMINSTPGDEDRVTLVGKHYTADTISHSLYFGITLLNENFREKADYFFKNFNTIYFEDFKGQQRNIFINKPFFLEKIYEYFYPDIKNKSIPKSTYTEPTYGTEDRLILNEPTAIPLF